MSSGCSAFARQYLSGLGRVLERVSCDDLAKVMEILERVRRERRTVFLAGNGGSAATASHMANDLMKTIVSGRDTCGLRAISLSDNTQLVTAIANDMSYDDVFAEQLKHLACEGDILIVISGSGNSKNIIRAVETAKRLRLTTIGFLGKGGGKVKNMVDVSVVVPSDDYGPIEDVHLVFNHLITEYLRSLQE